MRKNGRKLRSIGEAVTYWDGGREIGRGMGERMRTCVCARACAFVRARARPDKKAADDETDKGEGTEHPPVATSQRCLRRGGGTTGPLAEPYTSKNKAISLEQK